MATKHWPLVRGRPAIRLSLINPVTGPLLTRFLLADTGAGSKNSVFDLLLDEEDCLLYSFEEGPLTRLSGAYSGHFRVYIVRVLIDELNYTARARAVAVNGTPADFDGIAGFRFLRRFTYGNFGDPDRFGLES